MSDGAVTIMTREMDGQHWMLVETYQLERQHWIREVDSLRELLRKVENGGDQAAHERYLARRWSQRYKASLKGRRLLLRHYARDNEVVRGANRRLAAAVYEIEEKLARAVEALKYYADREEHRGMGIDWIMADDALKEIERT